MILGGERQERPTQARSRERFFFSPSLEHTPLHNSNNLVHLHVTPQIRVWGGCF